MKPKTILSIELLSLVIIGIIFSYFMCRNKGYYNITYKAADNSACLTFYNDKEYSLYDCDSEPTSYFFDSENECTYKYSGGYMSFNCKYNVENSKTNKIKVLVWSKEEFSFKYNSNTIKFKAEK